MKYIEQLKSRAKSNLKKIILPEATSGLILNAVKEILNEEFVDIILIGKYNEIQEKVNELNLDLDLDKVEIHDSEHSELKEELARTLHFKRENKGLTLDAAYDLINNPIYFGIMMLHNGYADGLVAGIEHSSVDILRPALQLIKTKENAKLVSSFFLMELEDTDIVKDGVLIFSDAGLVVNPNSEELSEIALQSAHSYEMLTLKEPRVGLLSYSTKGSAYSEMTQKVIDAYNIIKEKNMFLKVDGEIQADTALIPSVSAKKNPNSTINGTANVLIFPDLNSGNISYKLVQRLAKAKAYGPICQGLNKPVNDLSRGSDIDNIIGTIAITAVQAQE